MAHKVTAKYTPPLQDETEVLNLINSLNKTHEAFVESEAALRSRLTKRIITYKKRVKSHLSKKFTLEKEQLSLHLLSQTERRYSKAIRDAEQDCLQVAIMLAKSIIGEAIENKTSNLGERLKSLLKRLPTNRPIRIAVHQDEVTLLHEFFTKHSPEYSIDLLADSRIPIGNARIETAGGKIEVSWKAHFDEIVALLQLHQSKSEYHKFQSEQGLDA